jgi:hypothetical protein
MAIENNRNYRALAPLDVFAFGLTLGCRCGVIAGTVTTSPGGYSTI